MKFVYTLCLGTIILALGCPLYAVKSDTNNEQTTEPETAPQAEEDNACTICVDKEADFTPPCCKNKAICSECWDRATKDNFSCPFCRKIDETKRAAASDQLGTGYGSDDAMSYETLRLLQEDMMNRINRMNRNHAYFRYFTEPSPFRDSFFAGLGNTTPALATTPTFSFNPTGGTVRLSPAHVGYRIFSTTNLSDHEYTGDEISVARSLWQAFSNAWSFLRAEAISTASMFMLPDCPHFTLPTIFGPWSNNSTATGTQDEEDPTFLTVQGFNVDDEDSTSLTTQGFDLDEDSGFIITPSPTPVATLQRDKPVPKMEINSDIAESIDIDKKGSARFIEVLALAVVVGASVLLYQKPYILRSPKIARAV